MGAVIVCLANAEIKAIATRTWGSNYTLKSWHIWPKMYIWENRK